MYGTFLIVQPPSVMEKDTTIQSDFEVLSKLLVTKRSVAHFKTHSKRLFKKATYYSR